MVQRLVFLVVMLACAQGHSAVYSQFMENDGWVVDESVFECSMTHEIPFFGKAVFATRAGEDSRFRLNSDAVLLAAGQARLEAQSPSWSERSSQDNLGLVPVRKGNQPIQLGSRRTEQMLAELLGGRQLTFTRQPWYGAEASSQVEITTVGFRQAYQRYLGCLAGLLPVNFDQIKRTSVYFGSNQYEDIRKSELQKLDDIVTYVKADSSVKEFYIDGHTDSVGARSDNLLLAENRANEVMRYLVNKGIPEASIVSRWHGERYPVSSNQSVAGRAKNRRVTIRLEKTVAAESMPLADQQSVAEQTPAAGQEPSADKKPSANK